MSHDKKGVENESSDVQGNIYIYTHTHTHIYIYIYTHAHVVALICGRHKSEIICLAMRRL